jgi:hypothetical protein
MKKYRFDGEFEGERLVDEVVRLKDCGAKQLVYSPKLMANIFLPRKELNEVEE